MKKHLTHTNTLSLNQFAGAVGYIYRRQLDEAIRAAELTSEVKIYTREEIAAYEASLKK